MMKGPFPQKTNRNLLYANKINFKDFLVKDLRFENDETTIYINESLSFDTRKLLHEIRNKCKRLGFKKIITGSGIIKVKVEHQWVKKLTKKDVNNLT